MDTVLCANCQKLFVRKRSTHKFCRNACRVANFRKRHGITSPYDFTRTNTSPVQSIQRLPKELPNTKPAIPEIRNIPIDSIQLRPINNDLVRLQNNRLHWQGVIEDAHRGIFPVATIGLAGAGLAAGKDGGSKFALGLLGAFIGSGIDSSMSKSKKSKAAQVIQNAQRQIAIINGKINQLQTMDRKVKKLTKEGVLKALPQSNNLGFGDIVTGEAYRNKNIPSLGFTGKWNALIGDPAPGFSLLFSGLPGNGKSTTAIEFSQYYQANHGKVLFVASEQKGVNKPLQGLLQRFNATFDIWTKPKSDIDTIGRKIAPYGLVVIDSVNHLGLSPEEVEELRERNPLISFVLVMQSTKDGKLRGSQKFLHNCDVHIEMKNFVAHQTKSRFAAPMEIPMF